jgi:putative MATE family efflux protein
VKSKIDFINGKTNSCLVKMFIPLLMAMTLMMIYNMVDSFWVGNMLGEQGLSALTAGTAIVLIMNSLAMGVGNGVSVMVAHLVGSGEKEKISGAVATILAVSLAIGVVICGVVELSLPQLLSIMGTPTEIFADAIAYLQIYLIGNVALFIYMQFTSIYRAFGDSLFQMKGMIYTAVFNAIFDPIFINLYGLKGAAVVTLVSEVLCLLYAVFYTKKHHLFNIDFNQMKCEYVKDMFRLSIPTTVQAIMPPISSAVMVSFITSFGLTAIAGFGVARNLELIMFMPTTGMCMAVTSIVGQCEGAGRFDRAKDYLKSGLLIGGFFIAIVSILVIAFSNPLTAAFGQGKEVALVVKVFFKIISIGYVLYMLTSCIQGYLTGIGKPELAMILLILYYIVFRIPAALIFKSMFGLEGIWIAFLVSHILAFGVAVITLLSVGCQRHSFKLSLKGGVFV